MRQGHDQVRTSSIGYQGRARARPLRQQIVDLLRRACQARWLDVLRQHSRRDLNGNHQGRGVFYEWRWLAVPGWASHGQGGK